MATHDPELRAHRDWLGLLQPVGLVVSPPALVKAQAVPSRNVAELQQRLLLVAQHPLESTSGADDEPTITGWVTFFQAVLGWSLDDIAGAPGGPPIPDRLELILPDYDDTLRPTFAVVDSMGDGEPLMLVHVVTRGTPLDEAPDDDVRTGWSASPQARLERLMREVRSGPGCCVTATPCAWSTPPVASRRGTSPSPSPQCARSTDGPFLPPCTCCCPSTGSSPLRPGGGFSTSCPRAGSISPRSPTHSPTRC